MVIFLGNCNNYQGNQMNILAAVKNRLFLHYVIAITTTKNSKIIRLYYQKRRNSNANNINPSKISFINIMKEAKLLPLA